MTTPYPGAPTLNHHGPCCPFASYEPLPSSLALPSVLSKELGSSGTAGNPGEASVFPPVRRECVYSTQSLRAGTSRPGLAHTAAFLVFV